MRWLAGFPLRSCVRGQSSRESWLEITQNNTSDPRVSAAAFFIQGRTASACCWYFGSWKVSSSSPRRGWRTRGLSSGTSWYPAREEMSFFFRAERFRGDVPEKMVANVAQAERRKTSDIFHQSAPQSRDADVVTEGLRGEITPAVSPALISINREALLLFSPTAAGSRCGSAAPPPSAYLWWLQAAEMKGSRQSRRKAEITSEARPKRSLAKAAPSFFFSFFVTSSGFQLLINRVSERNTCALQPKANVSGRKWNGTRTPKVLC